MFLYLTYYDVKPELDCTKDAIHRAQNKINSERVEEYGFVWIWSLELDPQV